MNINKQSDLLIAAEQACNNEERLAIWNEKKTRLAIAQRKQSIEPTRKRFSFIPSLRLRHD